MSIVPMNHFASKQIKTLLKLSANHQQTADKIYPLAEKGIERI